ncbi:MAG: threonylcarbamoyl-AMP synthase [Candidatus Nealsonbacteria bacterium]|nr:threonylcarbamoyl-AMP synthase [Candidatus Nealsonbacteria bacterium]
MIVLDLRKDNFSRALASAVNAIKNGQVLVCPTDTVYGLICSFLDKKAVRRMFVIKKRPKNKLFPVFVKDIKMAGGLANINSTQKEFLQKAWPGPVTCILPLKKGPGTIGIRIPNHKFVLNLIRHTGPLAQTSANISGQPASTRINEVIKQFEGRKNQPDLIIDAKNLAKSEPSTIIDLTVFPFKVLRQ